ncbi:MAG: sensor histidine kinase, partial [Bacteroidota bacterium]|nr:sensor histidine kinase [Bacteroidota bacterium]
PFSSPRFIQLLIASNLLLVGFYYLNSRILIPRLLAQKKILLYLISILAYGFLYLTAIYIIMLVSPETQSFLQSPYAHEVRYHGPYYFSAGAVTLFLIALVVSTGGKIVRQWFSAEEIREEITKQQLETELNLLKTQVNPHFLFNTLNSIYSLAVANNKKTADAVMKLSRIMRYTLEGCQTSDVELQQEIDFINSYIELQKLRLTNNNSILFAAQGNISTARIAPFVLIPFIENAFKYGISTHRSSSIQAHVTAEKNVITFTCVNDYLPNGIQHHLESTGMGISNTRRRLELLYPKKYQLNIISNDNRFSVLLTINLN